MARTQVNFRVGEDRREQWDQHVEQSPHYDKVSDLIKEAVRNQIERDNGNTGNQGSDFEIPEVSVGGEALERIQDLHNRFDDLEGEVSNAVDAVHAQQGVDPDVQPDVFQALPVGREDAVTAEELARTTGHRDAAVRFALENLRRNTGTVSKVVPLDPHEEQGGGSTVETEHGTVDLDPQEAGYEDGVVQEPRWYKTEGA